MPFEDLYEPLAPGRTGVDLRDYDHIPEEPDELVYRLGYSSIPVAGMPEECRIGRVQIDRTVGPVLTQQTLVRQRHGVPVVFDKTMNLEVEIGINEILTICQIRIPVPTKPSDVFADLHEEAEAALGILSSALDERVAIEKRLEDAIGLRNGEPINSFDVRLRLRNFLPFDVTEEEKSALAELALLQSDDLTPLTEAARWYLKAAQEGPTPDAIVYMWIAIEALTPHRTTSPKTVEAMLISAGFDPDLLGDISVGRLAGLRADIVHHGKRDHSLIREGFYRLESVVRTLVRHTAGIQSSWAPILTSGVFSEEARNSTDFQAETTVAWHEEGLPYPEEPEPAGLEWDRVQIQLAQGVPPMAITFEGDLQPGWQPRANHWLARGAEVLELPFAAMTVAITEELGNLPIHVEMASNEDGLRLRAHLFTLPNPQRELKIAKLIQEGLAQVAVMRLGIASESFGTTLIAMAGSWALYKAFYTSGGPFEGDDLTMNPVEQNDPNGLGMILGAALAGSPAAARQLASMAAEEKPAVAHILNTLFRELQDIGTFPELLVAINALAQEVRGAPTGDDS